MQFGTIIHFHWRKSEVSSLVSLKGNGRQVLAPAVFYQKINFESAKKIKGIKTVQYLQYV